MKNKSMGKNLFPGKADFFVSALSQKEKEEGKYLLDKYLVKDMKDWFEVEADLIITGPPFGIKFSGKNGNYHRNVKNVSDGYLNGAFQNIKRKFGNC